MQVSKPFLVALILSAATASAALAQEKQFEPYSGQPGKDVVWVPSPPEMVEAMMNLGKIGPGDFVVDLGSGDGRNVIAAAKRGAQGLGVEYNPDMVKLSERLAQEAGVADRAKFEQNDMFVADFSKATVLALFLLPSNLLQLRDKFLDLRPGTRIVLNTFGIQDWTPDDTVTLNDCASWCTAYLLHVPAKVQGTWNMPNGGTLTLKQTFQMVEGTFVQNGQTTPITGKLRGDQITMSGGGREMVGRVNGAVIEGTSNGQSFRLTRAAATN